MIKSVLTAGTLAFAATATPVLAGSMDVPTKAVSFADLDLATPEGQAALDRRIDSAARKVCFVDEIRTTSRIKRAETKRCYAKARASAANQVASIMLEKQLGG